MVFLGFASGLVGRVLRGLLWDLTIVDPMVGVCCSHALLVSCGLVISGFLRVCFWVWVWFNSRCG